jgi:hypothetical protein
MGAPGTGCNCNAPQLGRMSCASEFGSEDGRIAGTCTRKTLDFESSGCAIRAYVTMRLKLVALMRLPLINPRVLSALAVVFALRTQGHANSLTSRFMAKW